MKVKLNIEDGGQACILMVGEAGDHRPVVHGEVGGWPEKLEGIGCSSEESTEPKILSKFIEKDRKSTVIILELYRPTDIFRKSAFYLLCSKHLVLSDTNLADITVRLFLNIYKNLP